MTTFLQDLRYGFRVLAKNPGFTTVAVLTLALGVGANTAVFSLINAVLLRPLPYHEPDRLVQLWESEYGSGTYELTGGDYLDWQAQTQTLAETGLHCYWSGYNASGVGEPERVSAGKAQANFFSLLGVTPTLGRTFQKGEDQAGRDHVVLLSYGFWQRHFAGNKDAVGGSLALNNQQYSVVGVLPAWFDLLGNRDVWTPLDMRPENIGGRGMHQYRAIGRMKPGVSLAQAQAEMQTIAQRLAKQHPDSNADVGAVVISLKEQLTRRSRAILLILLSAVALVLLIACANVANLLLVRAAGRHREIALRSALGADRARVIRQLLTESILLSFLGAAGGLGLAWACVRFLSSLKTGPLTLQTPAGLDATVLLFTFALSVIVGILFGSAPALQVSQIQLNEELKAGAPALLAPTRGQRVLRHALVVGEIGLSLALLTGAGLLIRTLAKLREVSIGAEPEKVLTTGVLLPSERYTTVQQQIAFYEQLVQGLQGAPGVQAASVSAAIPLEHVGNGYIKIEGQPNSVLDQTLVEFNAVSTGYFETFGIPFLRGRNFTEQELRDSEATILKVQAAAQAHHTEASGSLRQGAIINQTMARIFWPNQDPLGRTFQMDNGQYTVLGVVADVKAQDVYSPIMPQAYYPLPVALDFTGGFMNINVRGPGGMKALPGMLRARIHSLDATLALSRIRTMKDVVSESIAGAGTGYVTMLLGFFGVLALALTAVGIYGVMAYSVSQRRHEIGIRIALGAHRGRVLAMVMGQGAKLALTGVVLGLAGAFALARVMARLVFGISATDPLTFVSVSGLLIAVALLACYIPARRATKVDPMVALRYE